MYHIFSREKTINRGGYQYNTVDAISKDFKAEIIATLNDKKGKMPIMYRKIGHLSRQTKMIEKKQMGILEKEKKISEVRTFHWESVITE